MLAIVKAFWQIALFRRGPEDLPDSQPLLLLACAVYMLVDIFVILALYPSEALVPLLLADVGFLALWSAAVLHLFKFAARLQRTLTALYGVGALLQVLASPLTLSSAGIPMNLQIAGSLIILLWSVAVYGHIYSRALTRPLGIGLMFSIIYFIVIYKFAAQWSQVN